MPGSNLTCFSERDHEVALRIQIGSVDAGLARLLRYGLAGLQLDFEAVRADRDLDGIAAVYPGRRVESRSALGVDGGDFSAAYGSFAAVETIPAIVPPTAGGFGPVPVTGPGWQATDVSRLRARNVSRSLILRLDYHRRRGRHEWVPRRNRSRRPRPSGLESHCKDRSAAGAISHK